MKNLSAGMLVRFDKAFKYSDTKQLWVVTSTNAKTVTLFKLGGDVTGRYLRVSPSYISVVDHNLISL